MSISIHHRGPSPEEEANELHHLPVGRPVAWLLLVAFLALIVGRPLLLLRSETVREIFGRFYQDLQKVAGAQAVAGGAPPAGDKMSLPRAVNRQLRLAIDAFDRDIEKNSLLSDRLQPIWQRAMAALGTGHESVHVGRDGWLEYRPAFEFVTYAGVFDPVRLGKWPDADPRPALERFKVHLAKRGIALWVMPVPSKVMIHPESFAPELAGRGTELAGELDNVSMPQLRAELEAAGIRYFDLRPVLHQLASRELAYFKTDSHWRPAAIEAAAAALAAALEAEVPLAPRGVEWRRTQQRLEYQGDLVRMLHLGDSPLFPAESIEVASITDRQGRLWKPDPAAEVLLLGDSFANIFAPRAGSLAPHLAFHLGRGVDRIAMDGGGPVGTREQLARELRENPRRLDGVKVVVLELAARELTYGRWRIIPLPPPGGR